MRNYCLQLLLLLFVVSSRRFQHLQVAYVVSPFGRQDLLFEALELFGHSGWQGVALRPEGFAMVMTMVFLEFGVKSYRSCSFARLFV